MFESEARYRTLAEAMPQIVWLADPDGRATYYNERWFEYTGLDPAGASGQDWHAIVHPDDLPETFARFERAARAGDVFEMEYRLAPAATGASAGTSAAPCRSRDADGRITGYVGTATDIDDQRRARDAQRFLVEAGAILGASLDYRQTLADVARAAVPAIADWAAVHVVDDDGALEQLAIAHVDPAKLTFAEELDLRYPPAATRRHDAARCSARGEPLLVARDHGRAARRGRRGRPPPRPPPRARARARRSRCRCWQATRRWA